MHTLRTDAAKWSESKNSVTATSVGAMPLSKRSHAVMFYGFLGSLGYPEGASTIGAIDSKRSILSVRGPGSSSYVGKTANSRGY